MQTLETIKTVKNPIEQLASHERTSSSYVELSTAYALEQLEKNGFEVIGQHVAGVRRKDYAGFQKHALFLGHKEMLSNEGRPQLMLLNDHRGMSSMRFYAGFFRYACLNQLTWADENCPAIKLRHVGNARQELRNVLPTLKDWMQESLDKVSELNSYEMNIYERESLTAMVASEALDNQIKNEKVTHIYHKCLDKAWRTADLKNTAWHVANRVQENLFKGRFNYETPRHDKKLNRVLHKIVKAKPVKSIERRKDLNNFIFDSVSGLIN